MALVLFWVAVGCIAYHLIGYPLCLRLLAALRGRAARGSAPDDELPTVSVIIPAHNEACCIGETLAAVRALDYPREKLELILVDDGSEDGTSRVAQAACGDGLRLVQVWPRQGKPNALNVGLKAATGEVVCFVDANVAPERTSLRRLVEALREPGVGAASATVSLRNHGTELEAGEGWYYRWEHQIQRFESASGSAIGVDGAMYAARRDLVRPLPEDTLLDDFAQSAVILRAGRRIVFPAGAHASETGTRTLREEWRRKRRLAAGSYQALVRGTIPPVWRPALLWKFVSHKLLRWALPWLLAVVVVTGLWLGDRSPFYPAIAVAVLAALLMGTVAILVPAVRRFRPAAALAYAVVGLVAFLLGPFLAARSSVLWDKAARAAAGGRGVVPGRGATAEPGPLAGSAPTAGTGPAGGSGRAEGWRGVSGRAEGRRGGSGLVETPGGASGVAERPRGGSGPAEGLGGGSGLAEGVGGGSGVAEGPAGAPDVPQRLGSRSGTAEGPGGGCDAAGAPGGGAGLAEGPGGASGVARGLGGGSDTAEGLGGGSDAARAPGGGAGLAEGPGGVSGPAGGSADGRLPSSAASRSSGGAIRPADLPQSAELSDTAGL